MFVSQRVRLFVFSRWKGFIEFFEFETFQGFLEFVFKMKEFVFESKKSIKRRKIEDKDDGVFEYEDIVVLKKKEKKILAEFIVEICLSKSNGKRLYGEKKCKVVDMKLIKFVKKMKVNVQKEDLGLLVFFKNDQKVISKKVKISFGIGVSILRVVNQMYCLIIFIGFVFCSKSNGSGKSFQGRSKFEVLFKRKIFFNEIFLSIYFVFVIKVLNEKVNFISIDKL